MNELVAGVVWLLLPIAGVLAVHVHVLYLTLQGNQRLFEDGFAALWLALAAWREHEESSFKTVRFFDRERWRVEKW